MGKFRNFIFGNQTPARSEDEKYERMVLGKDDGYIIPGDHITERTSMNISAVYACVRILSEDFASLPLHFFKQNGRFREKATNHPLYELLYIKPNSEMSSFTLREVGMTNLLLWGNCYIQKIYDKQGNILELWPLLSERMRVDRDPVTDEIVYWYTPRKGNTLKLSRKEVLHIPGLSFDGLRGLSPIELSRKSLQSAQAAQKYGAKFFENGARPSGVLEHPGHLEHPELIRETWNETYQGTENAHKVAVLEEGMKYHEIGLPPEDAQFIQTRKFEMNEICRIYRVPPHMIGDLEKATFSNIEQQSLDYVIYTLRPWIVRWEQAIQTQLLRDWEISAGYYAKFNVDGLLRGDFNTRMQGYATARQNGWMSANDIREKEDENPIPAEQGGDEYLINGALMTVGAAKENKAWKEVTTNEQNRNQGNDRGE